MSQRRRAGGRPPAQNWNKLSGSSETTPSVATAQNLGDVYLSRDAGSEEVAACRYSECRACGADQGRKGEGGRQAPARMWQRRQEEWQVLLPPPPHLGALPQVAGRVAGVEGQGVCPGGLA